MIRAPKILLFQEYFSPGYLAGGMQTATKHLLSNPNLFNIRIITSNADLNMVSGYPDIYPDRWTNRKFGERFFPVWYAHKGIIQARFYAHFYSFKPDWIYLQGIYGFFFFFVPLFLALWGRIPVIICPHGMLDKGSLDQKFFKKWIYLKVFVLFGWHKKIRWQATSIHEENQIRKFFGEKAKIFSTKLMVSPKTTKVHRTYKNRDVLHLLFYSRVSPKKNLHLILESMLNTDASISLSIVGPIEDKFYWEKSCFPLMALLGNRVCYHGSVRSLEDYLNLKEVHFMILPSDAENFSFAIFECLSKGIPVITSKNTPWENIKTKGGGFILEDVSKMTELLNELSYLSDSAYQKYFQGALNCAASYMESCQENIEDYHKLFSWPLQG
jgi:glycosyltransferase involved in cell wall biosynthesis